MCLVSAPTDDWQIGHTKIFMRSSVHGPLEAKRTALLQSSALLIQKVNLKLFIIKTTI